MVLFFYLLALLPVLFGGYLWYANKEVVWGEWLAGSALGLLTAGLIHFAAVNAVTTDQETWSGHVTQVRHIPAWRERWKDTETRYTGSGENRKSYTVTVTRYTNHPEKFLADTTISEHVEITSAQFRQWSSAWGMQTVKGDRTTSKWGSTMVSGDANDYVAQYSKEPLIPYTELRSWTNKLKANPGLFKFKDISPEQARQMGLFDWPANPDPYRSNRLLGYPHKISDYALDVVNSRIGPSRQANLIIIGFKDKPATIADEQRAYWQGGKKNDIVLCVGNDWVRVFGWAQDSKVFKDIETLTLNYISAHKLLDSEFLPLIEQEIKRQYRRKEWKDFDYISVPLPSWAIYAQILVQAISQTLFWVWAHRNEFSQQPRFGLRYRYR